MIFIFQHSGWKEKKQGIIDLVKYMHFGETTEKRYDLMEKLCSFTTSGSEPNRKINNDDTNLTHWHIPYFCKKHYYG